MWNSEDLGDVNSSGVSRVEGKTSFGNSVIVGDVISKFDEVQSPAVEGVLGPESKLVARGESTPNDSSILSWPNPVMWNSVDLGERGRSGDLGALCTPKLVFIGDASGGIWKDVDVGERSEPKPSERREAKDSWGSEVLLSSVVRLRKGSCREKFGTVGAFKPSSCSAVASTDGDRSLSVMEKTGTTWPWGSTKEEAVGEDFGDRSNFVWLDAHDLRKPGEKRVPDGADSGPGDIDIMLPVLARCIAMSLSGGKGAVRGVLEPEDASTS
jgi:hypothetical protein